jgi:fluoroquinolone transport system ATP-binding protein
MKTAIKVENLNFQYPGSNELILKNLSFNINHGEIFGFLGPSGSGKSTTQKILYKLLKDYKGEVTVMDKELQNWGKDFYHHIGVCFELPNHYSKMSALENLHFFGRFYKDYQDPMKLLAMVGLEKAAKEPVGSFSKGMKMRLNFIRSFLHDPNILFLDEPTSGLDPSNAQIVKDIIKNLKAEGKTIFLTTHQMQDANQLCDEVAFIVKGKIEVQNKPQTLRLQYGQKVVEVTTIDHQQITVPLKNLNQDPNFLQILQEGRIETIHSKEAGLDEIFIKVTGETLVG